jgi:hypothetical protein
MRLLHARFGDELTLESQTPDSVPQILSSPVIGQADGEWLKRSKVAGINVRTVGSFWNVVKYALTLPDVQNAIHLLPVWEAGVVGSIYGMSSWQVNPEFYSLELQSLYPGLNTPAKQLKAVIHMLHRMGKVVGMDVIPHTDRFSEMVLANPNCFEWLVRKDVTILQHSSHLYQQVEEELYAFLHRQGAAVPGEVLPSNCAELFSGKVGEERRLRLLFGLPEDAMGRLARRLQVIQRLHRLGVETVPATMAPPFRGLEVDERPEARVVDRMGLEWRDFRISQPTGMSRVFNPLARYKLYETRDEESWELDFDRPHIPAWDYVKQKYAEIQRQFGFDFMRGDMSHVQMNPLGPPCQPEPYYDLLAAVKEHIQGMGVPYFAYFAESFLAPRDVMGYGEEMDHLEVCRAEVALGDLQSTRLGMPEFLQRLRHYIDLRDTRGCAPCFTVMTSDKDDPRFDHFYWDGNEARFFISLFLADMPSYVALGFELRDAHPAPVENEWYTKLYVFHEEQGPKATQGPYRWGKNTALLAEITRQRLYAESVWKEIEGKATRWLIAPDATGANPILAWTQAGDARLVFVVNTTGSQAVGRFLLPGSGLKGKLSLEFSTPGDQTETGDRLYAAPGGWWMDGLAAGEGRSYRIERGDGEHG